ncbi:hypothetical protein BC938DRAFT_477080, partial [Jimgerdemannia flammicorona]
GGGGGGGGGGGNSATTTTTGKAGAGTSTSTSVVGELEEAAEAKDFFFVHQCALLKISKRIQALLYYTHHHDEDVIRTHQQVTAIEVELQGWYKTVSSYLRFNPCIIHWLVPPQTTGSAGGAADTTQNPALSSPLSASPSSILSHNNTADDAEPSSTSTLPSAPSSKTDILREQSSILLMLQYKTQWILLHKVFLPRSDSPLSPPTAPLSQSLLSSGLLPPSANSPAPIPTSPSAPQSPSVVSHYICTRSADTIVELADRITRNHGWCVFQQFINCLYQASTIQCRNALSQHPELRRRSRRNIKRVIRILETGPAQYGGVPGDLITCLTEFLNEHGEAGDNDDSPMPEETDEEKERMRTVCEAKMFDVDAAAAASAAAAAATAAAAAVVSKDRCCGFESVAMQS